MKELEIVSEQKELQVEVQQSRAVAEIQSAFTMAAARPRNVIMACKKIMDSCQRIGLAEQALYNLPVGGKNHIGPSIRLAEVLAQNWGNIKYGIKELARTSGKSHHLAYCLDLETNTSVELEFEVEHWVEKGSGGAPKTKRIVTDPAEIDRLIANRGARKLRNCILNIIPIDIIEDAEKQCILTMKQGNGLPMVDRIKDLVLKFLTYGVTQEMIEERIGHKVDSLNSEELFNLTVIGKSLQDKQAKKSDFFNTGANEESKASDLNQKIKDQAAKKETEKKDAMSELDKKLGI